MSSLALSDRLQYAVFLPSGAPTTQSIVCVAARSQTNLLIARTFFGSAWSAPGAFRLFSSAVWIMRPLDRLLADGSWAVVFVSRVPIGF